MDKCGSPTNIVQMNMNMINMLIQSSSTNGKASSVPLSPSEESDKGRGSHPPAGNIWDLLVLLRILLAAIFSSIEKNVDRGLCQSSRCPQLSYHVNNGNVDTLKTM